MKDSQRQILKCLKNNDKDLNIKEISRKTGLHRNTISMNLQELQQEDKVEKTRELGSIKLYTDIEQE